MNFMDYLEGKRSFYIGSIVIIGLACLFVTTLQDVSSFDVFWHLRMGQDLVESGLSPFIDHYSFTVEGELMRHPAWIFQVILYALVEAFGLTGGVKAYKFIALGSAYLLMLLWMWRMRSPALVFLLVVPLLALSLQFRNDARAELLSYPMMVASFMLYWRGQERMDFSTMWPIVALLFVWSNYHSVILGYIIFFFFFVDHAIRLLRNKRPLSEWIRWCLWGLAALLVGFLTPNLVHPAIVMVIFPSDWKDLIIEYQSSAPYLYFLATYAFIPIILTSAWLFVRQGKWGYLLLNILMIYYAITMRRIMTPASIVVLATFAHAMSDADLRGAWDRLRPATRTLAMLMGALVVVLPIMHAIKLALFSIQANNYTLLRYPSSIVEYLKTEGQGGNILNTYGQGGYLIYNLAPDYRVYIDGRAGPLYLYTTEDVKRYNEVMTRADALREEAQKYRIDYILQNNKSRYAYAIYRSGLFELDFVDTAHSLYKPTGTANLAESGRLMLHGYCYEPQDLGMIKKEAAFAASRMPQLSMIHQFHQLVLGYAAAEDPRQFLVSNGQPDQLTYDSMRFVGYQAIEQGMYDLAIANFNRISEGVFKDAMAAALAAIRAGQPDNAEVFLQFGIQNLWVNPEPADVIILWSLLLEIDSQRPLKMVDRAYIDQMAAEANRHGLGSPVEHLQISDFCDMAIK